MKRFSLTQETATSRGLEFPCFLPRPALHHDLRFREKFHGVASLSVQNTEEAFLPSTKREIRHRRSHADIDSDVPGRGFVAKLPRSRSARREQGRLVSVRTFPQKFHRVVDRIRVDQAQHRPENLR